MSRTKSRTEHDVELLTALREHKQILRTVHRIEEVLEPALGPAKPGEILNWGAALGRLLRELAGELERHFANEERPDGFYDDVRRRFPQFGHRLDRLLAEHGEILTAVRTSAGRAVEVRPEDAGADVDLACRVGLAIATLKRHEAEENEIIQRAFCESMGTGD